MHFSGRKECKVLVVIELVVVGGWLQGWKCGPGWCLGGTNLRRRFRQFLLDMAPYIKLVVMWAVVLSRWCAVNREECRGGDQGKE